MKNLKKIFKKQAFTLVELIIVIAIIAILVALAVLHISKASQRGRDVSRMGDLALLQKGLELAYTEGGNGLYPMMEEGNYVSLMSGNTLIAYQGKITKKIVDAANMSKMMQDPDGSLYTYLLTDDRKLFQLMTMLENEIKIGFISSAYAFDFTGRYPHLVGMPLGIIVKDTAESKNLPIQYIDGLTGLNLLSLDDTYQAFVGSGQKYIGTEIKDIPLFDY